MKRMYERPEIHIPAMAVRAFMVIIMATIGLLAVRFSMAATFSRSAEAESGTVTGRAAQLAQQNGASGNAVVVFGGNTGNTSGDGIQAATAFGWGKVVAGDEFSDPNAFWGTGSDWAVFDGVTNQFGTKSAAQVSVSDGMMHILGSKNGGIGGGAGYYGDTRRFGRWEVRERVVRGDWTWKPVQLLWPTAEDWPDGGEIDYREGAAGSETGGGVGTVTFTLHHGVNGTDTQTSAHKDGIDLRQWHNYAVEWTPSAIRGYIDGVQYYESTDTTKFPPRPMSVNIQLDWSGDDSAVTDTLWDIDWLRMYDL